MLIQILSIFGLFAFIILSFLFQREFYTLELGIFFGTSILILIEGVKLVTELTLFSKIDFINSSRKWITKSAIFIFTIAVIGMSFYATKETISRLNQDSVNMAQKKRNEAVQNNQMINDKKKIIKAQIDTLTAQLNGNIKLLSSYSNNPREFWKTNIKSIQKDNVDIKSKIEQNNKLLIALSQDKQVYIPEKDTKTAKMQYWVIIFLAGFMEAGVMFLCWFVTKRISNQAKDGNEAVNNRQNIDIKEIREQYGFSQKELAKKIRVGERTVRRAENEGVISPKILKGLANMNIL